VKAVPQISDGLLMALQVEPRGTKLNEGGRRMSALSVVVVGFVMGVFIYLCVRLASAAREAMLPVRHERH